jgi:hypothetical protein
VPRNRGLTLPNNYADGRGMPVSSAAVQLECFCDDTTSQQADTTVSRPPLQRLTTIQVEKTLTVSPKAYASFMRTWTLFLAFTRFWSVTRLPSRPDIIRLRY